jgi:hypothetical protein
MTIVGKRAGNGPGYTFMKHQADTSTFDPGGGNTLHLFLVSNFDSSDGYRNTDAIVVYGSTDIADGQWHYVKVTYDGSNTAEGIQIYVDGQPETMHTRVFGDNKGSWDRVEGSILNDLPLTIGNQWNGCIDEVKIWEGTDFDSQTVNLLFIGEKNFSCALSHDGSKLYVVD